MRELSVSEQRYKPVLAVGGARWGVATVLAAVARLKDAACTVTGRRGPALVPEMAITTPGTVSVRCRTGV